MGVAPSAPQSLNAASRLAAAAGRHHVCFRAKRALATGERPPEMRRHLSAVLSEPPEWMRRYGSSRSFRADRPRSAVRAGRPPRRAPGEADDGGQGRALPILVVWHGDRIYALDNRCPHLGFPLHRGSIADGILTCHWHHARFDLVSGGTFDPWADDVPAAEIEVRDGEVWVAPRTRYADGDAHWRNRLRQGMEHNIGLVIAKAVFGLIGEGIDPRILVRAAALFGTRHRDGWGAGLTVLTALGNLLPLLPNDDLCLALFQGIRRVASDCDGAVPPQPRQALTGEGRASSTLERWLRDWVLVRHRDGAERALLTAIAAGASTVQMAELMLIASTERAFADGGHLLDFVNKAFEALDLIGWEHAAAVLPAVAGELVQARGARKVMPGAPHRPSLPAAGRDRGTAAAAGERRIAAGPLAGPRRLSTAASGRASGRDLGRARIRRSRRRRADRSLPRSGLCGGAAGCTLRHRQRALGLGFCPPRVHLLQRSARDADARVCGSGAARELAIDPRWLRGIFYGAMSVYLVRFLNVPPAALPDERGDTLDDLPNDGDALRASFLDALDRRSSVDEAARLVTRYLTLGHAPDALIATLAQAVLREDAEFHTYQMLEAGVQQYREGGREPKAATS
jgi:nitrite reductase/ring-hydroxylating ferredoxin subunit